MTLLILGLLIWAGAHMFKRLAPGPRAAMGERGKAVVTVALLAALGLMVIGYRGAEGAVFWGRSPALVGINNLLMLVSVYLFAAAGMKTAVAQRMRHPMLTGVIVWAVAHLLVNGDVPSFVLFGGLAVWAVLEMAVIGLAQPGWMPPRGKGAKMEVMAAVGTLLVYGAIAGAHTALGYPTFG